MVKPELPSATETGLRRRHSAVHRPVDKVKENVGTGKDHAGVGVDGVRVLDDAEAADALLLGSCGLIVQ